MCHELLVYVCVWDCPLLEEISSALLPLLASQPCATCSDGQSAVQCVFGYLTGRVRGFKSSETPVNPLLSPLMKNYAFLV